MLSERQTFGSALKKSFYTAKGFRVYGQEQVIGGSLEIGDYYIDRERFHLLQSCAVRAGDVLLSLVGTVGRALVVPQRHEPGIINPRLLRLSLDTGRVSPVFLQQWLQSPAVQTSLQQRAQGGTMGVLNAGIIKALRILLPPLPEQRKIAAILTAVDETIEKTEAVIEQLGIVKKAMMQELLTRGIPGRHTRFKKTEIGEIPEEWEVTTIGDACEVHNNFRKPIKVADRNRNPGPYPYYGPTKALSFINEYRLDGEYCLLGEDGDHFLKYDSWPMTQLVSGQFNVNNHAHVIKGRAGCSTRWVANYFKHRDIVPFLTRQGANRYKLRKSMLLELKLAVPSPDEQELICRAVAVCEQRIQAEMGSKADLQQVKSALMSVLLTGELRVSTEAG